MKQDRPYALKGSSLVELLIALAITSFCASLATVIYLNLQKSSRPFLKIKAEELAGSYMRQALAQRSFLSETYKAEEFTVKKSVERAEAFPDCYLLRILVFDVSKKKLCELESLVNEK